MTEYLNTELTIKDEIAYLAISRPQKLNALDMGLVDELINRCRQIEHNPEVNVVIIIGSGKAFCAGGDIAAWSTESADNFGRHWVRDGHVLFDAIARLRQPVIAVLNGHALGGGLELAACADYRIAEEQIKIGQPETGLGIIPGWSGTQRCVRRFGVQIVRRMVLFGAVYNAEEAIDLGLVDQVVEQGKGRLAAEILAEKVLARGARATELSKMLINAAEGEERERILESMAGTIAAGSSELAEGVTAFQEKRSANLKKIRKET